MGNLFSYQNPNSQVLEDENTNRKMGNLFSRKNPPPQVLEDENTSNPSIQNTFLFTDIDNESVTVYTLLPLQSVNAEDLQDTKNLCSKAISFSKKKSVQKELIRVFCMDPYKYTITVKFIHNNMVKTCPIIVSDSFYSADDIIAFINNTLPPGASFPHIFLEFLELNHLFDEYKGTDSSRAKIHALLEWATTMNIKVRNAFSTLATSDVTISDIKDADDCITSTMETLYLEHRVYMVPTIKGINIILTLLIKHRAKMLVSIGSGNSLVEGILYDYSKRQGYDISVLPSDSCDECCYRSIFNEKYFSKYFPMPCFVRSATSMLDSQYNDGDTIFLLGVKMRDFSVDVLNHLNEVFPSSRVFFIIYTSGEDYIGTEFECEPYEFYNLLDKFNYSLTTYSDDISMFKPTEFQALKNKMKCNMHRRLIKTVDLQLIIAERGPVCV